MPVAPVAQRDEARIGPQAAPIVQHKRQVVAVHMLDRQTGEALAITPGR